MKKLLFHTKVPLIWPAVMLAGLVFIVASFLLTQSSYPPASRAILTTPAPVVQEPVSRMDMIDEGRSMYVRPLILSDVPVEDRSMSALKAELQAYVNQRMADRSVQVASVYVRRLNDGARISINENELFNPASMMKMAYMIAYLKEEDLKPGSLQRKLFFDRHYTAGNNQNIVSFKLKENSYYSIEELLTAMIVYSDNDATTVLMKHLNNKIFTKLFGDLRLPPPPTQGEYFIGVADYSRLFRVLYRASYLSPATSEYAIRLLLKSNFNEGIRSALDPGTEVASKFGERVLSNIAQLHEFGIVYYHNNPYLIGVMTKGNNLEPLKKTIGDISGIVYRYMKTNT
jgi:beta-lactamase class A